MAIFVVGGFNADITGRPAGRLIPRDSNVGQVHIAPGGVGFNIAANLCRMGKRAELVCALGQDGFSGLLRQAATEHGVGIAFSRTLPLPSCVYLCLNDDGGDMLAAINDTATAEQLKPEHLDMATLKAAEAIVLDCNISRETLEFVAENATCPIVADPVCSFKASRLSGILHRLHTIKPNLIEAQMLTGKTQPLDCARALVELGVQRAFVSLGEGGMAFAAAGEEGTFIPEKLQPVNTTGAGDSATAALAVCALKPGLSAAASARVACRVAGLTVLSQTTISSRLTPEIMEDFLL